MKDVAIVGYCRTGIAKAGRGALNRTHGIPLAPTSCGRWSSAHASTLPRWKTSSSAAACPKARQATTSRAMRRSRPASARRCRARPSTDTAGPASPPPRSSPTGSQPAKSASPLPGRREHQPGPVQPQHEWLHLRATSAAHAHRVVDHELDCRFRRQKVQHQPRSTGYLCRRQSEARRGGNCGGKFAQEIVLLKTTMKVTDTATIMTRGRALRPHSQGSPRSSPSIQEARRRRVTRRSCRMALRPRS